LFELLDGLCSPVPVDGVAHVTLAAGSRRGHGSAYAALSHGGIDADLLRDVLAAHRPTDWPADFAVDVTTWPRCDAECSPGRGFYYHPSRHSAGQPIVAGWSFLWIVGLSATPDSWTAPMDMIRPTVDANINSVTVERIRALLPRLQPLTAPLFAFDAGFDPVQLTVGLSNTDTQIVVRIRDDRKFFTPPPPRQPGRTGRPRRHGDRFSCADPATRPAPDAVHACDDDQYGHVDVQAWHRLHPPGRWSALLRPTPLRTVHARSRAHGPSKPRGRFRLQVPGRGQVPVLDRLENPAPQPPYPLLMTSPVHPFPGVTVEDRPQARRSVHRSVQLAPWLWHLRLRRFKGPPAHVSTPFQGRAPGPVSGQLSANHPGGVPGRAACGFLLRFRHRHSLLGHPVPPDGIPPPLLSAYRNSCAYPRV
jgi:hypothetical protein